MFEEGFVRFPLVLLSYMMGIQTNRLTARFNQSNWKCNKVIEEL